MIVCRDDETIIAQCTPKGSGALALLRITGITAFELATKISKLPSKARISELPSHTIHFGYVIDHYGAHIDQVMFLLMRGPKTFTGQDTVEITAHNNPFIIQNIIAQALAQGARLAQEGEFTKRAVLQNKIDLIQAEAINELIHANTSIALAKSLAHLEGSFSHWVGAIEKELLKALAYSESSFEFLDEEISFGDDIKRMVQNTLITIESLKKTFDQQRHIRQGVRIAIIGTVNAGKSSLFNVLLGKQRAIVTDIPGTTRDTIEAGIYKNSAYWTIIDTAGIRQTDDVIEQEGIKRSRSEAQQADIIVLVFDASRSLSSEEMKLYNELASLYSDKIISVHNKIDMLDAAKVQEEKDIYISTKTGLNIEKVQACIEEKIAALFESNQSPFLINQRHYNVLLSIENKLNQLLILLSKATPAYELISYHLNDALADISQLTGKSISEQAMDAIFREFCIGK